MTKREIDALIAEKVIKTEFSSDPAASKQLETKLIELGWRITIHIRLDGSASVALFCNSGPCERHGTTADDAHGVEAQGESKESALALAACRAYGVETE